MKRCKFGYGLHQGCLEFNRFRFLKGKQTKMNRMRYVDGF